MRKTRLVRIVAVLCLLTVVISTVPTVSAYTAVSDWFTEEIESMDQAGLIPAVFEEKDLRTSVTRLEMCAVAVTAFEAYTGNEIEMPETPPFSDTSEPVVSKAYAVGLIEGYEDGLFRPENILKREEFFSFVYKFLLAAGWTPDPSLLSDLSEFPDASSVSGWALEATQAAVGIGAVEGNGSGLNPRGTTTCEQALAMFYRSYTYLESWQGSLLERYPNLSDWALSEIGAMDTAGLIPQLLLGRDMSSPITRGEMCYVAVQAYTSLVPEATVIGENSPFTDVDDETITLAYELGLVNGFPDGTFRPEREITREQFFKITANFLEALDYPENDDPMVDLSIFTDSGRISSYAIPCTRLLVGLEIVKGNGDTLNPQNTTRCEQALVLFYRSYLFLVDWAENHPDPGPDDTEPGDRPEADKLVEFALQFLGCDYVWGGTDPINGFDCSGFVWYVYGQNGYSLGRTATQQWAYGWEVSPDELLPGDLVFFSDSQSLDDITHIGIYVGGDEFIHAANSKSGVILTSTTSSYYITKFVGARRIIA